MKDLETRPILELPLDYADETRAWEAVVARRRRRRAGSQSLLVVVALLLAGSPLLLRQGLPERGRVTASQGVERTPSVETGPENKSSIDLTTDREADGDFGSRPSSPTSAAARGTAAASAPPGSAGQSSPPPKSPVRREAAANVLAGCLADWCVTASAIDGPDAVSVRVDLCVAPGTRTRRFSFPTAQEVDFQIRPYPNGEAIWKWSAGQTFPRADHNVDVGSGDCVRWTTDWAGVTEDGQAVEPGTFELTGSVLAEQAGPPLSATTIFEYGGSE